MFEFLQTLLDANHVLIDIHGYNLSPIELGSTIFGVWSYVEIIRRKLCGLVLGVVSSLLLACLFYQLRLYSDMGLMLYYVVASLTALIFWRRSFTKEHNLNIAHLSRGGRLILWIALPLAIGLLAYTANHLHIWFPQLFPEAARFPVRDAITSILGITASVLIIQRKIDALVLWLAADILSALNYSQSGAYFLTLVYMAYVVIDVIGTGVWTRRRRTQ